MAENKEKAHVKTDVKAEKAEKVQAETVEVSRDLLEQLIASNKEAQKRIDILESNAVSTAPGQPTRVKKNKETYVKMRKYNGDFVIGWENVGKEDRPRYVYSEFNPTTRESVDFINLITKESAKPIKTPYVDYLRDSESVFVKQISKKEEEEVLTQGQVYKKDFVENGYGMIETTMLVPVEVITRSCTFIVDIGEGETLEINEKFLG